MAGAGFKTFNVGDILGASDVNTYLMQQTVMVFASASARNSAIAAPTEGMVAYLNDSGTLTGYDGTYWQPLTPASRESGTASATLSSGSPWSTVTGTVTFTTNRFVGSAPIVVATPNTSSSAQATVSVYSVTTSGFSYRISLYGSFSSTISIYWMATQG